MADGYASDLIAALRGTTPTSSGSKAGFSSFMPAAAPAGGVGLMPQNYAGKANNPGVQTMKDADPQYIKDWIEAHTYHAATPDAGAGSGSAGGGSGGGVPKNDNSIPNTWGGMSEQEQAQWYADHPAFAGLTQFLQNGFGLTSVGMLQKKLDPQGVYTQQAIARGFSPAAGQQQLTNYEQGLAQLAEQARLAQLAEAASYHSSSSPSYSDSSSNSYYSNGGSNFTGTGW